MPVRLAKRLAASTLAKSAASLYAIAFSQIVLTLATVPFLSRALEPAGFGAYTAAFSLAAGLALLVDYGFALSGTRKVAAARAHREEVSSILAGVLAAKLALAGLSALLIAAIFLVRPAGGSLMPASAILYCAALGLSPLWFFQGMERLGRVLPIDIGCRACGVAAIYLLVRNPEHAWLALLIQAVAICTSTALLHVVAFREVGWRRITLSAGREALAMGRGVFANRLITASFTQLHPFLLGLFVIEQQVGLFGGAERIVGLAIALIGPLCSAMYPRISHLLHSDQAAAVKVQRLGAGALLLITSAMAAFLYFFAGPVARIILGPAFDGSVTLLRPLLLLIPLHGLYTAYGLQWALPLGQERRLNAYSIAALAVYVAAVLIAVPALGPVGMCWAAVAPMAVLVAALLATYPSSLRGIEAPGLRPAVEGAS